MGRKVPAEARLLLDQGPGNSFYTDIHGGHWDYRTYILEVHVPGEAPVRVETRAKVPIWSAPRPGDMIKVRWDPKRRTAEAELKGDPRYDPRLVRDRRKKASRAQALLDGAPATGLRDSEDRAAGSEAPGAAGPQPGDGPPGREDY